MVTAKPRQEGAKGKATHEHSSGENVLRRDRSRTEAALREAVMDLLKEGGVLGGVNLQEVSDRSGVSRTLVYQYYGDRRELLRAALREAVSEWVPHLASAGGVPFIDRIGGGLDAMIQDPWMSRLVTLLTLDGDPDVQPMAFYESSHSNFLNDVEAGSLSEETDIEAVHAVVVSIMIGYSIHRESFARQMDVSSQELDDRVTAMVRQLFNSLVRQKSYTESCV